MPMMFRFAEQRRKLLEDEFLRIAGEMRSLGARRFWAAGDLAADRVGPESDLDIVVVHETEAPFRYRSDFFTSHLRPPWACASPSTPRARSRSWRRPTCSCATRCG